VASYGRRVFTLARIAASQTLQMAVFGASLAVFDGVPLSLMQTPIDWLL